MLCAGLPLESTLGSRLRRSEVKDGGDTGPGAAFTQGAAVLEKAPSCLVEAEEISE